MNVIPAKEARIEFTHLIDEVAFHGERYIVTRNGRELVAMVPISDLHILESIENERDLKAAEKAEEYMRKHGAVAWDEIEKRLEISGE